MKASLSVLLTVLISISTAEARLLMNFQQNLSWNTRYSRVLQNGKPIEMKDLRGPLFSGFFGNDEHWNLGTMTHGEGRCEMRIPSTMQDGRLISYDAKNLLFFSGTMMEWVKDLTLDSTESDFDQKGLFLATGFDSTPRTEGTPTRILVPIRCKGDASLDALIEKHFKDLVSVTR